MILPKKTPFNTKIGCLCHSCAGMCEGWKSKIRRKSIYRQPIFSILHETVLTVAQAKQRTASEEQKHLVLPDKFPQQTADANLFLGSKFFAVIHRVRKVGKSAVADGLLTNLVAQVKESDAGRGVALLNNNFNQVLQSFVIIKGVDRA